MTLTRTSPAQSTVKDALSALRERVDGEVRFDDGSRAAYSTDASNFRQVPIGVVVPRTIEAAVEAVAVCHEHDLPVVNRGGGTSLAGQCTNEAVVLDFSKYCHRVVSVDEQSRRCVVEPGIVLDVLNRQLAPTGLRFGPEPATHQNCTLGGMIGNNSCGATAQRTGKVVDNIASLDVLLHDGTRFTARQTNDEEYAEIERRGDRRAQIYRSLRRLRDEHGDLIRERYPEIPRRVSGYDLDSLLPEHGFDIAGFLVGSESTLVTVLHAELELVPVVKERTLIVLGFENIGQAADAVPRIVEHEPIALEGVDHYLIRDEQIKGMNAQALEELPKGTGFLMVQFGADTSEEADRRARAMLDALGDTEHDPDVAFMRRPGSRGRAVAGARGRARSDRARARPARHLRGLGGLGRPGRPARRLPARPARASTRSSATPPTSDPASTAISDRAACTRGSRSTSTAARAWRRTAGSWSGPQTWSRPTAARCPVSTATGRAAGSC